MSKSILCGAISFFLCSGCFASRHSLGSRSDGEKQLYEKFFRKTSRQPSNYTVIFRYVAPKNFPNTSFVDIDAPDTESTALLTANSTATGEKYVHATLDILNTTNLTVSIAIYGERILPGTAHVKPTAFTIFYKHTWNATQSDNPVVSVGQRQTSDRILDFKRKEISMPENVFQKFAMDDFKYENKRQYITAIQFSFNSTTATAFFKSALIEPHKFEAIVYDEVKPTFEANMTVFGYDEFDGHFDRTKYHRIVTYGSS